jgi:hypothetical protein
MLFDTFKKAVFRKKVIDAIAFKIADYQRKADIAYYNNNDAETSGNLLNLVFPLKQISQKLDIEHEVYEKAYGIYDFRNSGREGYILKNGKIVKKG